MAYIVLIVGILLVFYGANGLKHEKNTFEKHFDASLKNNDFKDILSQDVIIKRLDELDMKIEKISSEIEEMHREADEEDIMEVQDMRDENETDAFEKEADALDINEKIAAMHKSGMGIDEIASKLDMGKGEVLLRLGIRK